MDALVDSGKRTIFESGAVREVIPGKGRCDLLPLDVVLDLCNYYKYDLEPLKHINNFIITGDYNNLLMCFDCDVFSINNIADILLNVSLQFELGAVKYGDNNWRKGIPVKHYINSAIRHYLKHIRGDKDEMHKVAYMWNVLCAIWICKNKPNLNDYKNTSSDK